MDLLLIAQIIILLSLSALAIYMIVVLSKLREVLGTVDQNLKQFTAKSIPILDNLDVITTKLRTIVVNFDEQLDTVKESVETIKGIAENVAAFERRIQDAVESPIMEVMNTIGGIIRGFTAFLGRVTRGSVSE
ncbi:MAG: DUF948 domain-containing protein [Bacteroidota bacterium]